LTEIAKGGSHRVISAQNLDTIGSNLYAAFPQLGVIEPLRLLGVGFRSIVVETGGIVFRIAKNQDAANGYAKEMLLPYLRPRVPVTVPDPRWYAGPSDIFPFGIMGYRALPGTSLQPAHLAWADVSRLASGIAAFLLALHRIPVDEALALGLAGPADRMAELEALRDDVLPPLRATLTGQEYDAVRQWWDRFLGDEVMRQYTPVLQHGDFWYENMLVDNTPASLVGVIDVERAAVGDLAQDFATQLHLGAAFAARVLDAYGAAGGAFDATFAYRMWRLWELRAFDGLGFAVRHANSMEFEDAVRKLRGGPILTGTS
jgi:aminoglycoside 2''-phosphotransferase